MMKKGLWLAVTWIVLVMSLVPLRMTLRFWNEPYVAPKFIDILLPALTQAANIPVTAVGFAVLAGLAWHKLSEPSVRTLCFAASSCVSVSLSFYFYVLLVNFAR